MQYNPDEYNEILNIFKAESEEIIQEMNDGFLELEKNPSDKNPIKRLFQLAHSLKGAARMIGFNGIQDIAHKLEDILSFWEKNEVKIETSSFEIIYNVCDFLSNSVQKSVEQKADYIDDNLVHFLNKLDIFISNKNVIPQNIQNGANDTDIFDKTTDINAILLELMFILEKDDKNNDIDEIIMVASDNLKLLQDIFYDSIYEDIKNHISKIINKLSSDKNKNILINEIKAEIVLLKDEIYNTLNFQFTQTNTAKKEEKNDKKNDNSLNNDAEKNFDNILKNLHEIRQDKKYIPEIIENLDSILKTSLTENAKTIIGKIINILKLFEKKDMVIDNDCFTVILQGIYLAKRIAFYNQQDNFDNLNFMLQRLKVIENLFEIDNSINDITPVNKKENIESAFSGNDIDLIKKNLNAFELQEIKTLRVDTAKIDNLISQTGELLVNGIKTKEHLVELSGINLKLIQWSSASKKIINYLKYLEKKGFFNIGSDDSSSMFYKKAQNFFMNNADMISEIQNDFGRLYNIISEDDNKLHQTAMEIETIAKDIRILPLATIFHSFPRMMRDIANENDKKIDFIVEGSDTTVDKKLIEEIKMPLIHILRNAVSHGIEIPRERLKNGKSEVGVIKLSAKQADNNVIITIEDDGYGINLEKVKKIAIKRGLLFPDEVENMPNEQLMKLLFLPGFSTNDSINEISGRGIGLDIVKTKISNLNGDIQIDSVLNKGCKVTIKLPLVMSTLKTFIILIHGQKYAIPVSAIKFVKIINKDDIIFRNGQNCIIHDEHSIPVYSLSEVFGETPDELNSEQLTVIILENQQMQAAFITDKLLGDQEIFHKKLVAPVVRIKNVSGFTTLSTGEICLIINPYELIRNTVLNVNIPSFDIKKISMQNTENEYNSRKFVIFDEGGIDKIKNDISETFENTVVFNNIYLLYDYIQKNETDVFVCRIDNENKDLLKLMKYIKNDENLSKIKTIIISDLTSIEILNLLNHFKPDLYVRLSEYNKDAFIEHIKGKI